MSGKFGITKDTKSNNVVPFQPTELKPITSGYLIEVKADTRTLKDESTKNVLAFKFTDTEKKRFHTHLEWELDENDAKFDSKLETMQSKIKHIYEAYKPFPENGIGGKAKNIIEFFEEVAKAFNESGENNTPIYTNKPVWIKVAYSLSYPKGGLQIPYSPNFIEPLVQGKMTTLAINKKYETIIQPASSGANDMPGSLPGMNDFGNNQPF